MAQATGSRVQLGYVAETTFGTTPTTPSLVELPFTSFTGDVNPSTLNDATITSTRQKQSARRGNVAVEGTLEANFAPDLYDEFLESAMNGVWTTNVLKVGNTRKSFTIEQNFSDLTEYRVFRGVLVDSFKLSATTGDYVKASFSLVGVSGSELTGSSVDANGYTAAAVKGKFFHEGGVFKEGGSTVAYISSIELELTNSLATNYALGATGAREITAGMTEVKGKVMALFESAALYNKFYNNTSTSLEFTLTEGAESLTFLIPKVTYEKGSIPVSGQDGLVVELDFTATYDTTEATTLKITRV